MFCKVSLWQAVPPAVPLASFGYASKPWVFLGQISLCSWIVIPPFISNIRLIFNHSMTHPYPIWQCVKNLVPLVNIKIAGKWMFIPLKMVLIGIDP